MSARDVVLFVGSPKNPDVEFGDLFRFYDAPARAVLGFARGRVRRQKRLERARS